MFDDLARFKDLASFDALASGSSENLVATKGQGPGHFSSPAEGTESSAGLGQHRKIDSKGQRPGSYRT